MQRYFCEKKNNKFYLSKEDSYHINKVMRNKIDDLIEVVDNNTLYIAKIISLDPTIAEITEQKDVIVPKLNITLAQSLVNEQKMDYILQKSTELGIDSIIPIETSRSVIKTNNKQDKKIMRWQTIVKEASEQSKRLDIPKVYNITTIKELAKLDYDYKILCSVNEMSKTVKTLLSNVKESDKILFVVGPEGGFTKEEEQILIDNDFISVSLGSRVLRTETASLFFLSIINYIFMR